jgi:hypothetical protein
MEFQQILPLQIQNSHSDIDKDLRFGVMTQCIRVIYTGTYVKTSRLSNLFPDISLQTCSSNQVHVVEKRLM